VDLGYLGDAPVTSIAPNKKPRLGTPVSAPSPTAAASPAPAPVPTKAASKPVAQPVKSKVPTEPLPRLKYLLQECLDTDDDDEEARVIAHKVVELVSDIAPEQTDMVTVAAQTIAKFADEDTLEYLGKLISFPMRLRKWIVYEHNKEKKSTLVPKLLKVSKNALSANAPVQFVNTNGN
jgi:hypothetical protein